ncbi:MAG TPA: Holliday junction branch migration protein RuvA [Rickettsiales bacterium]|nr:Holliday junction branch migration protein RuvA [Rickettsiales bacterium]
MIGKLKGRVDDTDEDSVIIDVGGVGYHVFCSSRTLAALPGRGEAAELVIETHVREEHIHLLGFPDMYEREWFRTLTGVQGVGVKMALAILGVFTPAQLAQAIAAKDTKSLTRVSGVGPKLAERLTTELKNKIAKLPSGAFTPTAAKSGGAGNGLPLPPMSASEDTISALVNLGYSRSDAYNAVAMSVSKLGQGDHSVDVLIKESLRALVR